MDNTNYEYFSKLKDQIDEIQVFLNGLSEIKETNQQVEIRTLTSDMYRSPRVRLPKDLSDEIFEIITDQLTNKINKLKLEIQKTLN